MRTRAILARLKLQRQALAKSAGAGVRIVVALRKSKAPAAPAGPKRGDFVRVQRPDIHQAPILARLIGAGKDGVMVADESGRRIKVRHQHVVERSPAVSARERAAYHASLAERGIRLSTADRFLHLDPRSGQAERRATASQIALLEALTQHGAPVDVDRVRSSATHADAQDILQMFITDPEQRIV